MYVHKDVEAGALFYVCMLRQFIVNKLLMDLQLTEHPLQDFMTNTNVAHSHNLTFLISGPLCLNVNNMWN